MLVACGKSAPATASLKLSCVTVAKSSALVVEAGSAGMQASGSGRLGIDNHEQAQPSCAARHAFSFSPSQPLCWTTASGTGVPIPRHPMCAPA
jgi:hypothetical protein